jgi:nucleotide-binding universal stress UspA family protein
MKKILIALDYDPTAQRVADMGHALAKAMGAQTVLLHVTSDTIHYSYLNYSPIMGFEIVGAVDATQADAADETRNVAAAYLDKSKRHLGDETIQTVVRNGSFGETILNAAREVKADTIVMGTHNRRGLERILMGSVAQYVLHHSSIPVLIIPTNLPDNEQI